MTENVDDFYTKKHQRLSQIATTAHLFSWITLFFYILLTISQFISYFRFQDVYQFTDLYYTNPEVIINAFLSMLRHLFNGFVYFLVLRAVSFSLNMIVETDLNYRDNPQGGSNE
jgi:hypothetical protein